MNIIKQIKQNLNSEFPNLSKAVITLVLWHVLGGARETYDDVYRSILEAAEMTDYPQEKKDLLVYHTLLRCGREYCSNPSLIDKFQALIREVEEENQNKHQQEFSNARYIAKNSPLLSKTKSSALIEKFEDTKATSLK